MAGFTPIASAFCENSRLLPISSLTLAIGDLIELDVGAVAWTVADSSTEHWQLKAIVQQAATTAATEALAALVVPGMLVEAEVANSSSANHNGDRMLLTDQNTVNNSGTDSTAEEACFIQLGVIGAATDLRVLGLIVPGTGINPDAA